MNMCDLFYLRKHTLSHDRKFIFLHSLHVVETRVFSKTNHYFGNQGELITSGHLLIVFSDWGELLTAQLLDLPTHPSLCQVKLWHRKCQKSSGCRLGRRHGEHPHTWEIEGGGGHFFFLGSFSFPLVPMWIFMPPFGQLLLALFCLWSPSVLASSLELLNLSC